MTPLQQISTDRTDVRQLWEALDRWTRQIAALVLGRTIATHTWTGAGSATIAHTLGRSPAGWIVVDRSAAITVHRTAWTARDITLVSDGAGSVAVLVF